MSTTPARSSVATVYSRCERELAFLGTHGYTFRVRPPSQIRGYSYPYPTPRRPGDGNLVAYSIGTCSRPRV
jgi:hypothetical protein